MFIDTGKEVKKKKYFSWDCLDKFVIVFQAKVILGEEREATGSLLSIDGGEGVIKLDGGNENIKMLPIRYLCKMPS